jgi:uracil-DNA glycosylase family 4
LIGRCQPDGARLGPGSIDEQVVGCTRCPRLAAHLESLRDRFPDYWNRPVPSFGDPRARLAILGLAPGLHGANRSGRPFYMDASGEWLYAGLERLGLWNGERLTGAVILNAVKCVPPQNRPRTDEVDRCRSWLEPELEALPQVRVVLALGAIAHRSLLRLWQGRPLSRFPFRHGVLYRLPGRPVLLSSYHPSRQNTQTGVLTRRMWSAILRRAARLAADPD